MGQVTITKTAVEGIFRMLDLKPSILVDNGKQVEHCKGQISLKSVEFFYPSRPEAQIFSGVDLAVPSGKVVALVGPSGSGKSSVVGLVQRFYDPQAGSVFLDGEDITSLNAQSLRTQVGW